MDQAARRVQVTAQHLAPQPASAVAHQQQLPVSKTKFEYTVDNNVLTLQQREFYEENGYLLIPGLIKQPELEVYRDRFIKLCNKEVEDASPFMTYMRDLSIAKKLSKHEAKGEALIAKLQDFEEDPVLFNYCKSPEIIKYVKAFTGPDVKSVHTMFINKPPGSVSGGRHPLHQDKWYFPFGPANRIVAAWTAIDHCNMENGCLQVLPGTHKGDLLLHSYPEYQANAMYHGVAGMDKFSHIPRFNAIMAPGDTIFFHPILIHGSGPNNTTGYRKAISGHFASAHCEYIEITGTMQENMAKEFDELRKKLRPDFEISYADFWRFKARLVSGNEDTL